jgi:hypothetical protein
VKRISIILCLLFSFVTETEAHACKVRERQTIEIHVIWRFASPDLNQQWIAKALEPRIDAFGFSPWETAQSQSGESFEVTTCLSASDSKATLSIMTFSLGGEKLFLSARPIQWTVGPKANRYGRMTAIVVPPQPNPKKLILGDATMIYTDKNEPRLKVDFLALLQVVWVA